MKKLTRMFDTMIDAAINIFIMGWAFALTVLFGAMIGLLLSSTAKAEGNLDGIVPYQPPQEYARPYQNIAWQDMSCFQLNEAISVLRRGGFIDLKGHNNLYAWWHPERKILQRWIALPPSDLVCLFGHGNPSVQSTGTRH